MQKGSLYFMTGARSSELDELIVERDGDRLWESHSIQFALGVLDVKNHGAPRNTEDFRNVPGALASHDPLKAGDFARAQMRTL